MEPFGLRVEPLRLHVGIQYRIVGDDSTIDKRYPLASGFIHYSRWSEVCRCCRSGAGRLPHEKIPFPVAADKIGLVFATVVGDHHGWNQRIPHFKLSKNVS